MELKTVGGWESLKEKVMLFLFSPGDVLGFRHCKEIPGSRGGTQSREPPMSAVP